MKLSDVKEGDKLVADAGFTCMRDGQASAVVRTAKGDLAIPCDKGLHVLDGQVGEGGELVGFSREQQ